MTTTSPIPYPDLDHERSNEIIHFVLRNHVATTDAIRYRVLPPGVTKNYCQKLVRKLVKRSLLKRWPLHAQYTYLRIGSRSVERWQYEESYYRRLGPQKLPYELGCLWLMAYHEPPLTRLFPHERATLFPDFPDSSDLRQWAYYEDSSEGEPKLATLRVEYRVGGDAVITKLNAQLYKYRKYPLIDRLLDSSRFVVHIVTATQEQENAIWNAYDRIGVPAELRVNHVPSLTMFL